MAAVVGGVVTVLAAVSAAVSMRREPGDLVSQLVVPALFLSLALFSTCRALRPPATAPSPNP